jgi:hypothetical protein
MVEKLHVIIMLLRSNKKFQKKLCNSNSIFRKTKKWPSKNRKFQEIPKVRVKFGTFEKNFPGKVPIQHGLHGFDLSDDA